MGAQCQGVIQDFEVGGGDKAARKAPPSWASPPPRGNFESRYSEVNSGGFNFGVAFSHFVFEMGVKF